MVDIPRDIWLYVAQFIPDSSLQRMVSVNSVFFDIAMHLRYREISVSELGDKTMKILIRLEDPAVAWRVRRLLFRPYFKMGMERKEMGNSWRRWMHTVVDRARRLPSVLNDKAPVYETPARISSPLQGAIQLMIAVFPGLVNVTEFCIDSWNVPSTFNLQPLLTAAWSGFGRNLQKLSLGGNLESFREFAASSPCLEALQELTLEFTNNLFRLDNANDAAILLGVVAPFVNGLSFQLRYLRMSSWASLDLSDFFMGLGPFPVLEHFSIRAAFNVAFKKSTSGLTRMLRDHSNTLRRVELKLKPTGSAFDPTSEQLLAEWMSENTSASNTTILANLQNLQIYPTMLPTGFDALTVYVRRSANTLTSLSVRDRYLLYAEVEVILQAFDGQSEGPPLTSLHLNVHTLSARLIDLLAIKLPGLKQLDLFIGEGAREELGAAQGEDISTLEIFRAEMQGRMYTDWKLCDIGIWQGGPALDADVLQLLGRCIPSLESFWGKGDKTI